jgi:hypothetical protein
MIAKAALAFGRAAIAGTALAGLAGCTALQFRGGNLYLMGPFHYFQPAVQADLPDDPGTPPKPPRAEPIQP